MIGARSYSVRLMNADSNVMSGADRDKVLLPAGMSQPVNSTCDHSASMIQNVLMCDQS